ncbi:hypothetical protein K1719_021891 [Acacia pycnantha]|nr:hypothetical protein K1719_021891 [Acacia pycnantha]
MTAKALSPSPVILTQDDLNKIVAYKAVEYVESGMVLGLGTGSTTKHTVDKIGDLLQQGKLKHIIGIPTRSKTRAKIRGIKKPFDGRFRLHSDQSELEPRVLKWVMGLEPWACPDKKLNNSSSIKVLNKFITLLFNITTSQAILMSA